MNPWVWMNTTGWPLIAVVLICAIALALLVFIAGVVGWFVSGFLRGFKSDERAKMTAVTPMRVKLGEGTATVNGTFRVSEPSSTLPKGGKG